MWSCWIFPDRNPLRPTLPSEPAYLETAKLYEGTG